MSKEEECLKRGVHASDWNDFRRRTKGIGCSAAVKGRLWNEVKAKRGQGGKGMAGKRSMMIKLIGLVEVKKTQVVKRRSALKQPGTLRIGKKKVVRISVSPSKLPKKEIGFGVNAALLQKLLPNMPSIPAHYCCHAVKKGRREHSHLNYRSIPDADGICRWQIMSP